MIKFKKNGLQYNNAFFAYFDCHKNDFWFFLNVPGTSGEIGPKNCLTWDEDNKSGLDKSGFDPTPFEPHPPRLRFLTTPFWGENILIRISDLISIWVLEIIVTFTQYYVQILLDILWRWFFSRWPQFFSDSDIMHQIII